MAVGTPALVGGQHVVIRPEMSPHASAVLFVSRSHVNWAILGGQVWQHQLPRYVHQHLAGIAGFITPAPLYQDFARSADTAADATGAGECVCGGGGIIDTPWSCSS
jgi:hypothetical protein